MFFKNKYDIVDEDGVTQRNEIIKRKSQSGKNRSDIAYKKISY